MASINDHQLKQIQVGLVYLDPITGVHHQAFACFDAPTSKPIIVNSAEELSKQLLQLFVGATMKYKLDFTTNDQNMYGN